MFLGKPPGGSLPVVSAHSFASNTENLLFLKQRKREIFNENVPGAMDNLGTAAYEADTLPTELPRPVWIKEVHEVVTLLIANRNIADSERSSHTPGHSHQTSGNG